MSDLKTNNMPIIFKEVRRHPIWAWTFATLQRKDNITYLNCIRNITKMRKIIQTQRRNNQIIKIRGKGGKGRGEQVLIYFPTNNKIMNRSNVIIPASNSVN